MAEEIKTVNYSDDNIITLDGLTHIRRRAGMYMANSEMVTVPTTEYTF